jgi:thiamine-monophosphate kinase
LSGSGRGDGDPGSGQESPGEPVGRRNRGPTTPLARIGLGRGAEFDLIRRLLGPETPLPPGLLVGPGDDCAVLEGGIVVSVDLSMEDVHFKREWISLHEAGYRATAAALSDLAAMAAEPLGVLLSMALGPGNPGEEAAELQAGAENACRLEGTFILGGDLAGSPGPVVLDVVVLGRSHAPVLRSGSRPGDEVWVSGWLGGSAGAVAMWIQGLHPPEGLRSAFARPRPRIREALWLADRVPLRGLVDISDGLAGDAGHLAAASGVSVVLEEDAIPVHPDLEGALAGTRGESLGFALGGGEDYELCLTVPPGALQAWAAPFERNFGIPLTRVGTVIEGDSQLVLLESGQGERRPLERGGFSHFAGKGRE